MERVGTCFHSGLRCWWPSVWCAHVSPLLPRPPLLQTHSSWMVRCNSLYVTLGAAHPGSWWPLINFYVSHTRAHSSQSWFHLLYVLHLESLRRFQLTQSFWNCGPGSAQQTQGAGNHLAPLLPSTPRVLPFLLCVLEHILFSCIFPWEEMTSHLNFSISCHILWCDIWCSALVFRVKLFSLEQK